RRRDTLRISGLRQLLIRGLGGLVGVLVVMAMAGSTYQTVSTMLDERVQLALGRLVDAGRYRLHLNCSGQGSPTVLLQSGLANRADWDIVQPQIAAATRVCSYDRAGIGWSDPDRSHPAP